MFTRHLKKLFVAVFCCAFAVITSQPVCGGLGTMVSGTPSFLNLNLYYTYVPADMNVMNNVFQETSRLLFNSTNGQLRIGTVTVSANGDFQNKADFWVNNGAGGARAAVGGFGTPGAHVTLFVDRHRWTNHDGPDGNEIGQFGIIHETGHYVFNLYDEYNVGGRYPGACCVTEMNEIACIMDGGTTLHPQHHRTEWCTAAGGGLATSHVTSPNTPQQVIRGHSCWEEIVSYCTGQYGTTFTAPATVQTGNPAGLGTISWVTLGDRLRMALALDRSYSMSVNNKEPLAKQAASLFIDLCERDVGEGISVVSFSNTAVSDYPMHDVNTIPDTKTEAISAVNAITLEDMTALGDGLRRSLNEITGGGIVPAGRATEAIVLLTDGVHNFGAEAPAAVIPDLRSRGVRVFTVGVGDVNHPVYPLDESTLLDISSQTGASYTHAADATQLPSIYVSYAADIRGMDSFPEETGELAPGDSKEQTVLVDKFIKEITFVLHWPFGANALELTLERPGGVRIGPATAGIEYIRKSNYIIYRIKNPKQGKWKVIVSSKKPEKPVKPVRPVKAALKRIKYNVQVLARAPGLSCKVSPRRAFYKIGEPAIVRAFVYAGGVPVANVNVTGLVRIPNGELVKVKLYDDGKWKENGDDEADDGVYSARFFNTKFLGTYRVSITVNNVKGVVAKPDEPDAKWEPKRVAQFIRASESTFSVGRPIVKAPKKER